MYARALETRGQYICARFCADKLILCSVTRAHTKRLPPAPHPQSTSRNSPSTDSEKKLQKQKCLSGMPCRNLKLYLQYILLEFAEKIAKNNVGYIWP
jgi:hypothetical protein